MLSLSGQGERRGFVPQWYHRHIPLSFLAIHNCAISEDDTDLSPVSAGVFNA